MINQRIGEFLFHVVSTIPVNPPGIIYALAFACFFSDDAILVEPLTPEAQSIGEPKKSNGSIEIKEVARGLYTGEYVYIYKINHVNIFKFPNTLTFRLCLYKLNRINAGFIRSFQNKTLKQTKEIFVIIINTIV